MIPVLCDKYSYNTFSSVLANTIGRENGIYDMNGGACERVATYLDNSNTNLSKNGNGTIKYFDEKTNILDSKYKDFLENYEVSDEEKIVKFKLGDGL